MKTCFSSECLNGFFGYDCNSTCKNCNISSPGCLQSTGHCLSGCESKKWLAPKCDGKLLICVEKQSGLTLIKNSEFDYFVLISILNAFEINYHRIKGHTNSAQ